MKKSVVKNITKLDPWEGKFGKMYSFKIVMENGDIGDYNSKSPEQNKFEIGKEVEYTYEDGAYPKIKPFNNFVPTSSYSNNNTDQKEDIRFSVAFKGAIDLASNKVISLNDVEKYTMRYNQFLKDKKFDDLPF